MQATVQPSLSNVQVELLKLFAAGVPDAHLEELKFVIARYLLEKARVEADKAAEAKGYTPENLQQILQKQL
ncbi:MAG: hypothetical protein EPO28_00655 [Saprospiraceae bacterium]|nr:MAG: hypothetical protein EPO28_00655 [Saprospiraceae bacterium]